MNPFDLLTPLDYPRQSAYNLARSAGNVATGDAGIQDLIRAVPGLAGLAATPFLGPMGGAAVAGGAQGLGKLAGLDMDAPTPGHLVEALGGDPESFFQTMAAQMATDPLTYAGTAHVSGALGKTMFPGKPGLMPGFNPQRIAALGEGDSLGNMLRGQAAEMPQYASSWGDVPSTLAGPHAGSVPPMSEAEWVAHMRQAAEAEAAQHAAQGARAMSPAHTHPGTAYTPGLTPAPQNAGPPQYIDFLNQQESQQEQNLHSSLQAWHDLMEDEARGEGGGQVSHLLNQLNVADDAGRGFIQREQMAPSGAQGEIPGRWLPEVWGTPASRQSEIASEMQRRMSLLRRLTAPEVTHGLEEPSLIHGFNMEEADALGERAHFALGRLPSQSFTPQYDAPNSPDYHLREVLSHYPYSPRIIQPMLADLDRMGIPLNRTALADYLEQGKANIFQMNLEDLINHTRRTGESAALSGGFPDHYGISAHLTGSGANKGYFHGAQPNMHGMVSGAADEVAQQMAGQFGPSRLHVPIRDLIDEGARAYQPGNHILDALLDEFMHRAGFGGSKAMSRGSLPTPTIGEGLFDAMR